MKTQQDVPNTTRGVAQPSSLGDVARRITSRTTDLFAVSIVLVASLTFGRQILNWWHAAPPQVNMAGAAATPAPAWEDERQPLSIEFGDLPLALTRQVVMGDRAAAVKALVEHCRAGVKGAKCPVREPDDAEQRLLEKVAGLKPVVEKSGDWQVYVVDERFTLVVAVRWFLDCGAGVPPNEEQAGRPHHNEEQAGRPHHNERQAGRLHHNERQTGRLHHNERQAGRLHHKSEGGSGLKETARPVQRLVCWGFAMSVGENAWTLYVFRPVPAAETSTSGMPSVPLPPGANRNLSLRDERGGLLLGFSGNGLAQNWMTFYDDWFAGQGWSKSDNWSIGKEAWSVRFAPPLGSQAGRVEIRIATDQNGELTGLLQIQ